MGKAAYIVLLAGVVFVSPVLPARMQSPKEIPLHHFKLPCGNCHIPELTGSADKLQKGTSTWQVNGDINRLCSTFGCHDFDPMLSHPVGIKTQGPMPADMPLDSGLRITCLTCHDKLKLSDNLNKTDIDRVRFLRIPEGIQFCGTCHIRMGGTLAKQSHWQFSTRAHLDTSNKQPGISGVTEYFTGGIDTESRMCLSCHDNITVTIPPRDETTVQKKHRWKIMTNHPIGMEYSYVAVRKTGKYIFPLFDSRIRLFNGRVGCGSCHSPYSQIRDNLVNANVRGALCRNCHNM